MKKIISFIIASIILFSITLSGANAVVNVNTPKKENNLKNIADLLTAKQLPSDFESFEKAKAFTDEYDRIVLEQFNSLSVAEKYEVLDIINNTNVDGKGTLPQSEQDIVINAVIEDLKNQNIFIFDITDEEFNNLVKAKATELGLLVGGCTAPIKNFPGVINYQDKPSSQSYTISYSYQDVRTEASETICDLEVFYNTGSSNPPSGYYVWGTTALTRTMISVFFGGSLSTRFDTTRLYSIVVGGLRSALLTDAYVADTMVIWKY